MSNAVPFFYIFIVLKLSAVGAYMLSDLGKGKIIFQDVKMSYLILFQLKIFFYPPLKVYANIGTLAEEEIMKCDLQYIENHCTELLVDNRNIFEGYLLYLIVVAAHIFILLSASLLQYHVLCNSGQNIHDCSVAGVIQAPIRFFDVNPAGRILNRFRKTFNFIFRFLAFQPVFNL